MWRRLFQPEVLFLLGTLQGLSPYLFMLSGAVPASIMLMVSYYPLAIWVVGYLSFWLGTRLVPSRSPFPTVQELQISLQTLKFVLGLLCVASLLEMVGLARLYGGIPLLMFASGAASVNDTNNAQTASGFGQVGATLLTLDLLVSALILFLIKCRQTNQKRALIVRWLLVAGPVAFTLCVFNGKRQGLFMYALIVAASSVISFGSPFDIFCNARKKPFRRINTALLAIGILLLVLPAISGFANLRNNGRVTGSGLEELESYYLYPMMNLALQCTEADGFGPYRFDPRGVFTPLLPSKLVVSQEFLYSAIPKVEITSPSGFYERLHWYTGLCGIVLFPLVCGVSCQYMYNVAHRRYAALLTYGFIAWALFSAPIYNHFVNLLFLPLPAALFWIASFAYREITALLTLAKAEIEET